MSYCSPTSTGSTTRRPGAGRNANLIPLVERITAEIEGMAGAAGSELSRGGMQTKIEAAKIATTAGTHLLIASGKVDHPLAAVENGARCTWFLTPANPVTARKKWIAGSLEPRGTIVVDAGAVAALRRGKSLLPAGVVRIDGPFARGDAVIIRDAEGGEVGRGLIAYDAEDAARLCGKASGEIERSWLCRPRRDDSSRRSRARPRLGGAFSSNSSEGRESARSDIRTEFAARAVPDFASLNPGYATDPRSTRRAALPQR